MSDPEGERGDKALLDALKRAATRSMTPEERHQQRLSFIVGTMSSDSGLTREDVQRILDEQDR